MSAETTITNNKSPYAAKRAAVSLLEFVRRFASPRSKTAALSAVIFIIGIAITILLFQHEFSNVRNLRDSELENGAKAIQREAAAQIQTFENKLRCLRVLFNGSKNVKFDEWRAAASEIVTAHNTNNTRAMGIGYIEAVRLEDLIQYLVTVRTNGLPNYQIVPESSDANLLLARYVFPGDFSIIQPGFAVQRNLQFRAALESARDSGRLSTICTGDSEQNRIFTLVLPVYKNPAAVDSLETPSGDASGWVFVSFASEDLLHILRGRAPDGSVMTLEPESDGEPESADTAGRNTYQKLQIGNESWQLRIWSRLGISDRRAEAYPWLISIIGVLLSGALAWIVILARWRYERMLKKAADAEGQARNDVLQRRALSFMTTVTDNGVILTDSAGIILWVNDEFAKLTEYTKEDVIGKKPTSFIFGPGTAAETIRDMRHQLAEGGGFRIEFASRTKSEKEYWVENEMRPIRDQNNNITNFIVVQRDITDRKRAQAELELTRDAALTAARQKSQFMENLARELRTHLTGVIGMNKMLVDTKLAPEQLELARTARRSGDALAKILEDANNYWRVEAGSVDLEQIEFDPREMVEDLAELYADGAGVYGLELICLIHPDVPLVVGYSACVRQVLVHLMDNAVEFTNVGEIIIEVKCAENRDAQDPKLRFSVRDTGVGITKEDISKLFSPFERGSNVSTRKTRGSGLGLAVSQQLVKKMGGAISVRSEAGRGSEFTFEIPFRAARAIQVFDRTRFDGKRILLADDQPASRAASADLLRSNGATVTECEDGASAIAIFKNQVPENIAWDAVVLDQEMPGLGGFAVAAAIRGEIGNATIPIVLLTVFGKQLSLEQEQRIGVHTILSKPLRASKFLTAVEAALRGELKPRTDYTKDEVSISSIGGEIEQYAPIALVVEDDSVCQTVAKALLKKLGWRTDTAKNGALALDLITKNLYDVILMDCQMPEMNGFEATAAIRGFETNGGRIPIIAMTANAAQGEREKCIEVGMDDYLSKPVKLNELRAKLAEWYKPRNIKNTESFPAASAQETRSEIRLAQPVFDKIASQLLHRLHSLGLLDQPTACEDTIQSFVRGAGDIVASTRVSLATQDTTTGLELTQRLQRASSHFGAVSVAEAAVALLEKVKINDISGAIIALDTLEKELNDVREVALEIVKDPDSLQRHATL
ncbi:MAG: response regulator, partial [Planctomycetota bacterium]